MEELAKDQNKDERAQRIEEVIEAVLNEVRIAMTALVGEVKASPRFQILIQEDPNKAKEIIVEIESREELFVKKVLTVAHEALGKYPKGIALFDVDETLVRTAFTDEEHYKTIIRPGALPVLKKLHELGFMDGLITTRGPREGLIAEAMTDKRNLAGIKDVIDTDYVFTTKDAELKHAFDRSGLHAVDLSSGERLFQYFLERGVVRPDLSEKEKSSLTAQGNFSKSMIVAGLKSRLGEDTSLIVADDLSYPSLFDKANGIYGVELPFVGDGAAAFALDKRFIDTGDPSDI